MRAKIVVLSLIVLIINFEQVRSEDLFCQKYNYRTCDKENKTECMTEEKCPAASAEARSHCFTYWEYDINMKTANVQMMGCFMSRNNPDCYNKTSHCNQKTIRDSARELYFCCCNGNLCSENFTKTHLLEERVKLHHTEVIFKDDPTVKIQYLTLGMGSCTFVFLVILGLGAYLLPRRKSVNSNEQSRLEAGDGVCQEAMEIEYRQANVDETDTRTANAELVEKLAVGRFGAVWRARRGGEVVAVKVFPLRHQQSWKSELEIFRLPFMEHDHLLQYVGARRHGEGLDAELWLVTPYHELGSLSDYLTKNVLTCDQMFSIAASMTSGLKHLHQEVGQPGGGLPDGYKPSVAHRDFKSRNVLLSVSASGELRASVADFGLALTFHPEGPQKPRHGRVGTLRYMAPEVLQGAISFNCASFLSIDMYACGLVLWELAYRCRIDENSAVEDYCLPFEKEVGLQPTLEEMLACVVEQQKRPYIPEFWREHPGLSLICETIEDCWDKDPEARLSSSCVFGRMSSWREKCTSV